MRGSRRMIEDRIASGGAIRTQFDFQSLISPESVIWSKLDLQVAAIWCGELAAAKLNIQPAGNLIKAATQTEPNMPSYPMQMGKTLAIKDVALLMHTWTLPGQMDTVEY